ncbi:MAG: sigma-70 family RNA polymerase sigma factor [Bacteroidota bacterium]
MKLSPDSVAIDLDELQRSSSPTQQFPKILLQFRPLITSMASNYSTSWKDDFVQEGTVALHNAIKKYLSQSIAPDKFIPYAVKSIRFKMTDFYNSVIGRTMFEQSDFSIDGGETKIKKSYFTELPTTLNEEGEEGEHSNQLASPTDYVASITLGIDFKYHFSMEGLSRNGFTKNEIAAFNLHFLQGYNVSEVSEQIGVSISQASKIISNARRKAQLILSITETSNLN